MSSTQPLTPRTADGTPINAGPNWVLGQSPFLRTDDGTQKINVDGTPPGASTVLWNGTGAGDTGGDWARSGEGSESAGAMHSGTNGLDTGITATKDLTTLFDNGSPIDIAGGFSTLKFWMNPQAFPSGAKLLIQWQNAAGAKIGAELDVANYVANYDLGGWQQVAIPIGDFTLTADVQKLQLKFAKTGGIRFFFDDFELIAAASGGGPFTFRVEAPDALTRYHVSMVVIILSGPSTGWNESAFANIAAGLTNGLILRHRTISTGEVKWALTSRDNVDLFGRFHPQESITFANGVLLVGFMIKPGKASVVITNDDVLEVIVEDNLSTLSSARAFVHYATEKVTA